MKTALSCTLALAILAGPALADEQWTVDGGEAFYDADYGDVAMFTLPYGTSQRAQLYIEGLPSNMDNRGSFAGYWIAPGEGQCTAVLTGPDGTMSTNWGWAEIVFDRRSFPSGWTLHMQDCGYAGQTFEMVAAPF